MGLYKSVLRPLAFKLDPEFIHEIAMAGISRKLFRVGSISDQRLTQTLFGVDFPNPIGLAAGFDKNAVAVNSWHQLGFGHVECGTITFQKQSGNSRPRLFRIPENQALINRMGFNNDGAAIVSGRLRTANPRLRVGINLGKSKVTELADAPQDYAESFRLLRDLGDYFVVNVSSPNTPGLRSLQEKGPLLDILGAIRTVDATKPLFVKIAPDLEFDAVDDVISVVHELGLTGIVATNTTLSRNGLARDPNEAGGLSGAPLRDRAQHFMRHLRSSCDSEKVLIGVGGIFTAQDAYDRIAAGAHVIQVYTGWVYGGPKMVPTVLRGLLDLMDANGIADLAELRQSGADTRA